MIDLIGTKPRKGNDLYLDTFCGKIKFTNLEISIYEDIKKNKWNNNLASVSDAVAKALIKLALFRLIDCIYGSWRICDWRKYVEAVEGKSLEEKIDRARTGWGTIKDIRELEEKIRIISICKEI